MIYEIWHHNKILKTYYFKIQAIIWCYLNGFVNYGRNEYWLDENIKIKELKSNDNKRSK